MDWSGDIVITVRQRVTITLTVPNKKKITDKDILRVLCGESGLISDFDVAEYEWDKVLSVDEIQHLELFDNEGESILEHEMNTM